MTTIFTFNKSTRICAILVISILSPFLITAQITGSNTTTVADNGSDPQNVNTSITMPSGTLNSAADLTITFSANHTWIGDVTAVLTTPCGSTTLFARPNGGSGNDSNDLKTGGDYVFNASSATNFPASSGGKVLYGTYSPNFGGISYPCDISGNWTLTLTTNSGDHGRVLTLNSWSISIVQTAPAYFDSDDDGVLDNIDIDDDNDGILDTDECDTIVNPPLLNPDFEAIDILTLDGGPTDVVATSGIWKGDASHIPNWLSADPTNNYLEIWHNSQAAGNDAGGQAYSGTHWAEVNATTNDGLYQDVVSTPGDVLQWSFAHRKRTGYANSGSNQDVVRLLIGDPNGTLTPQGDFTSADDASWTLHFGTYTVPAGQTSTRLTFTVLNTVSGSTSSGNFIDNVELYVIPNDCADTDGDSVPDYLDLDSDNDGIPDIVEAGFGSTSNGTATIPLTSYTDNNNNGMHDAFENIGLVDSDGDGTPDYLDLDSDNDTIFDVDESGAGNSANSSYDNGDGDIDGDGIGDGPDTDAVREKDDDLDGNLEYFADGILDIYDYYTGSTISLAYGNSNQGNEHTLYVMDSDNDGIPDYRDIYNDTTSTYDISQTFYADLDANNDGVIDGNSDVDGDGISDLFDTDDANFGSPRDIDQKLQLFFDGRNDYVQDVSLTNAWGEITLMGWIKIDPSGTGTRVLFGQENFSIRLNTNNQPYISGSGISLNSSTTLNTNKWVHISGVYSDTDNSVKLYINGELDNSSYKSGLLSTDTSLFTIARRSASPQYYFKGFIDETRLFDKALSDNEIQKIVYQEIENNSGTIQGTIIPRDITNYVKSDEIIPLGWSNLVKYYRFDTYKGDITDDLTTPAVDTGTGAKLYNIKILDYQSAPMPFVSQVGATTLPNAVNIAADGVNGNDAVTYDWSILKIEHNDITFNDTQRHLGLFINEEDSGSNPIEYHVTNDSELNVSWYLKLDGFIDLEGESQLVQGDDSVLDVTSKGKIERDQQGTADTYTYNYWSSPVGAISAGTNNNDYTLSQVLKDGTTPTNPVNINFISNSYDGTNTSPIGIADYWIWKFDNHLENSYSSWQHVRKNGIMSAGEGFTMKGPGTGPIAAEQNYVFEGKPNNGNIDLSLNAGNSYLVGNPYPSAIDAHQFIMDNGMVLDYNDSPDSTPTISGTLYFWEHWGGGSHVLSEYQGGYAIYNYSGAVAAPSYGTNDPNVATGGTPTKLPGRYIPVGQGFFVVGENTGTLSFNNNQRVFKKEDANSVFMRSGQSTQNDEESFNDQRMKFRIGFNSVNTIHRQLLLTIDSLATPQVDRGFDAIIYDDLIDDMYWMIEDNKFTIQGYNTITDDTKLPLGLHTADNGTNSITIDALENVPEDLNIYLHDLQSNTYHDLRASAFSVNLNAGEYLNRFEITFSNQQNVLNVVDEELNGLYTYFASGRNNIIILNPNSVELESLNLYNINGQSVYENKVIRQGTYHEYEVKNLSTGVYIIKLSTIDSTYTKKIIIK